MDTTFLLLTIVMNVGSQRTTFNHEGNIFWRVHKLDKDHGRQVVLLVPEGVVVVAEALLWIVPDFSHIVFISSVLKQEYKREKC